MKIKLYKVDKERIGTIVEMINQRDRNYLYCFTIHMFEVWKKGKLSKMREETIVLYKKTDLDKKELIENIKSLKKKGEVNAKNVVFEIELVKV